MSIWVRITDFVGDTASSAIVSMVEAVRTVFEGDPETRRRVAFSVAMIALSAKMAKADGVVTPVEVDAFQEIFDIPDDDAKQVSMLFNLAKQDVAGYETYASQLASLCSTGANNCPILRDIIDGLFHIAKADDLMHSQELEFLRSVAEIFKISEDEFERIVSRHVDKGDADPYKILNIEPKANYEEARARYLKLVRDHHPDMLTARGLPLEFIRIADERMAAINAAWALVEPELKSQ